MDPKALKTNSVESITWKLSDKFKPVIEHTVISPNKDDDHFTSTDWRRVQSWVLEDPGVGEKLEANYRAGLETKFNDEDFEMYCADHFKEVSIELGYSFDFRIIDGGRK